MSDAATLAATNVDSWLRANEYPGRGIVLGLSGDGRSLVQVYWIMGRSENSRNRVFVQEGDVVRTAPHDVSKVQDPSLIIYAAVRQVGGLHVVTNGAQTDTIAEHLAAGGSFESALRTWHYEPDAPNYTPRISGLTNVATRELRFSKIIKDAASDASIYSFYEQRAVTPGFGWAVHTYRGDGNPLPSFDVDPYLVPLGSEADDIAETFWAVLNPDNRVSLLTKIIDVQTGESKITIRNRHATR